MSDGAPSMRAVPVAPGAVVRATDAWLAFVGGGAGSVVVLNGDPHDYLFERDADAPGHAVLAARNGSGRYRFAPTIGEIRFLSGVRSLPRSLEAVVSREATDPAARTLTRARRPVRSYAQIQEDILLYRALRTVDPADGFYVDVGAYEPDVDSVTRLFYELGWRGINVEPVAAIHARLEAARPRDVNVRAIASDRAGTARFYANDGQQLGTAEERFAREDARASAEEIATVTLAALCDAHARGAIHFLKVDVEGHERAVLAGMDFGRHRPWIVMIEATLANHPHIPAFGEWEAILLDADYLHAGSDELNRYYVAREHADLARFLTLPVDYYRLD